MTTADAERSPFQVDGYHALVDPLAGLVERLGGAGHRCYLVGGVVRDLLVGRRRAGDDIDLTTDARPEAILEAVRPLASAVWRQGERFGTIGATIGTRSVEITTHRAEVYDERSRKPEVVFGDDLGTDLSRRDFTINAMAVDLADHTLVDPFGGREDLAARRLRTPLEPAVSFRDDPLRMLRAARFVPRFDLAVDPPVEASMTELADRLAIVSAERIRDELVRLLALEDPSTGLDLCVRTGLWDRISPTWPSLAAEDRRAAMAAAARPASVAVRLAVLAGALGRPGAGRWLDALRLSTADRRAILTLLDAAADLGDEPSAPAVRRLTADLGVHSPGELEELWSLVEATGRPTAAWRARVAGVAAEEPLGPPRLPVDGRTVMEEFGVAPGPAVGRALDGLRDRWIAEGPMDREAALAALRADLGGPAPGADRPLPDGRPDGGGPPGRGTHS